MSTLINKISHKNHRKWMPITKPGKWAVGFGAIFTLLLLVSLIVAFVIKGDATRIEGNPLITVLNAALNLAGLASFLGGIYAIFKYKDWPVLRALGLLYSLAIVIFLLGEFSFPH